MIQDFQDIHEGKTAVVIGNGKSLEGMKGELKALGSKYHTFGANKIYGLPYLPDYWTCVDRDMLHDCIPYVLENWPVIEDAPKIFTPRDFSIPGGNSLNVVIEPMFSVDASEKVILGGTVTFVNLQLAYYMGFATVLLVGLDHRYPQAATGVPGSRFLAKDDEDPDHFEMEGGEPYFSKNRHYNRPELDNVAIYTYPMARKAYERAGRRLINLTPNSALGEDVFKKQKLSKWV